MLTAKSRMRDFLFFKSRKAGDCVLWRGGSHHVLIGAKYYKIGRLVYQTLVGRIPLYHDVRHTCLDKMCMNVKHLYLAPGNAISPITPAGASTAYQSN